MSNRFEGKTVIVTGAASGLGACCVQRFAAEGANAVLVDVSAGKLQEMAKDLAGAGVKLAIVAGSVSDEAIAAEAVRQALDMFGSVDILINNAAIDPLAATSVTNTSLEDWDRVMAVNVRGAFLFAKAVLPHMQAQRSGVLVHTASISALKPTPDEAAYSVSKAAILQLSHSIALDYACYGIRSNAICPGFLEAVMSDRAVDLTNDARDARSEAAARMVPLGREGTYDEIAETILFLSSDASSYTTGAAITIDGGMMQR
jgi:NAD(P)-dependent dehydrogenase (short-subunit alcohol dehydrogenase family)